MFRACQAFGGLFFWRQVASGNSEPRPWWWFLINSSTAANHQNPSDIHLGLKWHVLSKTPCEVSNLTSPDLSIRSFFGAHFTKRRKPAQTREVRITLRSMTTWRRNLSQKSLLRSFVNIRSPSGLCTRFKD
ncbi:hypothetical protein VTL71DRAFT_12794, partial [Oculimacula yallundae]